MSLNEIFNTSSNEVVNDEMKRRYFGNDRQRERIKAATRRKQLYKGGGVDRMNELLEMEFYEDPRNASARKKFTSIGRFDNATRRIVHALASLYRKPATRTVKVKANNERYQALLKVTGHDELMRRGERMTWLQNSVFIRCRVQDRFGERVPITDVLTQSQFHVISWPDDPLVAAGIAIDHHQDGAKETARRWLVWTATEKVWFDGRGVMIAGTREGNDLEMVPGVLVHREQPDDELLEMVSGSDIEAAGWSRWLASILLLKEMKSVTRQTILSGDLSTTPDGQQLDTEAETITGEGVGAQALDRGVDLRQFMEAGDHAVDRAAGNYGISSQELRNEGATSGHEVELRRIPQEEQRVQQVPVWRRAEREFAVVQSKIMAREGDERYEFTTDGWRIDFAEPARHLNDKDKFELRKLKRQMGHSNVFMELMEDNPDLDEAGAKEAAMTIQAGHALWIELQRKLKHASERNCRESWTFARGKRCR